MCAIHEILQVEGPVLEEANDESLGPRQGAASRFALVCEGDERIEPEGGGLPALGFAQRREQPLQIVEGQRLGAVLDAPDGLRMQTDRLTEATPAPTDGAAECGDHGSGGRVKM